MKKMSIFALLLAAVLVTSYSVSGTYAKYTSEFNHTDSARVANWAFSFKGNGQDVNQFTFDLFNTVKDTNNGVEENISATDGSIIAPGTEGSFEIGLANNSEVDAKYTITYTMTNASNIPVEFSANGTDGWTSDIEDLNITDTNINKDGATDSKTVYWRWTFEGTDRDSFDTQLGSDGATITVGAKVVATQID